MQETFFLSQGYLIHYHTIISLLQASNFQPVKHPITGDPLDLTPLAKKFKIFSDLQSYQRLSLSENNVILGKYPKFIPILQEIVTIILTEEGARIQNNHTIPETTHQAMLELQTNLLNPDLLTEKEREALFRLNFPRSHQKIIPWIPGHGLYTLFGEDEWKNVSVVNLEDFFSAMGTSCFHTWGISALAILIDYDRHTDQDILQPIKEASWYRFLY